MVYNKHTFVVMLTVQVLVKIIVYNFIIQNSGFITVRV
jgi:hypothetical protein